MGETYYDVLGVDPDASRGEITAAYRERVLETHPDRSDDPDAAATFDLVTTARDVLVDADERARYDRLGHEAYRRLQTGGVAGGGSGRSSSRARSSASGARARSDRASAGRQSSTGPKTGRSGASSSSGKSHHARQRAHRRRARYQNGTRATDWFGGEESAGSARGEPEQTSRTQTGRSTADANATGGTDGRASRGRDHSNDGFRYAVHDWDDDVELTREYQRLGHSTAVMVACIALCYPVLVYASLTPTFPWAINLFVGACTLVLAGSLLTLPRVAIVTFGSWSLLASLSFWREPLLEPFSILGLLGLAAFWVPFGYALAIWWALRP